MQVLSPIPILRYRKLSVTSFVSLKIMKAGLTVTNKTLNLFKISQVTPSFYEETTLIREIQTLNNGETI